MLLITKSQCRGMRALAALTGAFLILNLASCFQPNNLNESTVLIPLSGMSVMPSVSFEEIVTPVAKHNTGKSGFYMLRTGKDAFEVRLGAVQGATKTLDIQYYIVEDDETGSILLDQVLLAADRGIKVRIIVDELHMEKAGDTLSVLNLHPNIEVRGFNPITTRKESFLERIQVWLTEFDRYTRRMHNKALISDGQVAIVGGRNLGDSYFDNNTEDFNFSDLDVLAAGPIVSRISASFERYWNSDQVHPLYHLDDMQADSNRVNEVLTKLKKNEDPEQQNLAEKIRDDKIHLVWAEAEFSADKPEKADSEASAAESPAMRLDYLLDHAEKEFVAVSPYLVPTEDGMKWFENIVKRGIRVRILTNSLASTDVFAVHAAYSKYREALVKLGIDLYELKPVPGKRTRQNILGTSSRSSLHSKIYIVDRRYVIVGSFNLDPRSIELNNELGIVIDSPVIAKDLVAMFEESIGPEISYHLTLNDEGALRWETRKKNRDVVYDHDPEVGIWRKMMTGVAYYTLSEDQL